MPIKKGFFLPLFLLFFQANAFGETVVTTVFNVLESKLQQKILVLSGVDGRIYKTHLSERNMRLMRSFTGDVVKLTYYRSGNENLISNIALAKPEEVGAE